MIKCVNGKKNWRIFLLLSMFLCILLVPAYQSKAAPSTGTVKNRVLNVRTTASTSSAIVCKLTQGTKVSINSETTGSDGRKWYKVSFSQNGATGGYVRADLLKTSESTSSGESTVSTAGSSEILYVNAESVHVREEPDSDSETVAGLTRGTEVKQKKAKVGRDGRQWTKVSFTDQGEKKYGYIRSDLLTDKKQEGSQSSSGAKDGDTVYVNASAVRVREQASDSSKVIANLLKGDSGEQIKTKKGDDGKYWTKISFYINDIKYKGYIRSDLLTASNPNGTSASDEDEILYVNASAVRVRDKASNSSKVVANLLQGDSVKLKKTKTGDDGKQWTKVSFTINDTKYQGYIRSDLLSKSKSDSASTSSSQTETESEDKMLYVKSSSVRVREEASTSSSTVVTLQKGMQVKQKKTKTGADGKQWTKVSFTYNGNKTYGYIRSDLLTEVKSGNTTSTVQTNTSASKGKTVRVAAVNVRSDASATSSIKATLTQGSSVSVLSEKTGTNGKKWSKVSFNNNGKTMEGYIRSDLLN